MPKRQPGSFERELINQRWPEGRTLEEDCGRWLVAHMRSRHEKALAKDCEALGVGYYLPLFIKRTRRSDTGKIRKSILPLFPGYVPFVDEGDSKRRVLETGRTAGILDVPGQDDFVRDLMQIWKVVEAGIPIQGVETLAVGTKVRIMTGPMEGLTGIALETKSRRRLLLNVNIFQMAVAVELGQEDVEPL